MGDKFKSVFAFIIVITLLWLLFSFLNLPQNGTLIKWKTNQIKLQKFEAATGNPLDLMKYVQIKLPRLKLHETLFYQFDPNEQTSYDNLTVDKVSHDKQTLKLGLALGPIDQYVRKEGKQLFAFDLLVSNRIGLIRPLPDTRHSLCDNSFPDYGPISLKASIIICYYNEAPSALLRTIHSIINRSPSELIKEIIIIDDFSEQEFSSAMIKPYITSNLVKLTRTKRREGLIRARLIGSQMAEGDVLIFLDSHVEANKRWLEPLLSALKRDRKMIVCPMIDLINAETLIYTASPMVFGGLGWALNFKWDSIPSIMLSTYADFIKPIPTPTMAGGLYAIRRDYFNEIGEYDSGMNLWGGENIELSLRTWMCGGKIFILPCSRLGHIFRKRRPYGPELDQPDSFQFNSLRTAKVWLGEEWIEKHYEATPEARHLNVGDLKDRLELKQRLNCHNFTWYLENLYPDLLNKTSESTTKRFNLFNHEKLRASRQLPNVHLQQNHLQEKIHKPLQSMSYLSPSLVRSPARSGDRTVA